MGVIKHLAEFLRMLSVPCRLSFLPILHDILHSTNPFNWRLRQCLAIQLPDLIALPPVENLFSTLCPLVTTLLQDSVVSVRRYSYKGVAALINALASEAEREAASAAATDSGRPILAEAQLEEVASVINILARGDTYNMRLVWVELCRVLLREIPQPLFEKYFVEGILLIASDQITNVRIAAAAFIAGWEPEDRAPWEEFQGSPVEITTSSSASITTTTSATTSPNTSKAEQPLRNRSSPWKWLLARYDIQQCVLRLARDDRDIVVYVRKLQPMFPDVVFKDISCRGMKYPPGGATAVELCKVNQDVPSRLVRRNDIIATSSSSTSSAGSAHGDGPIDEDVARIAGHEGTGVGEIDEEASVDGDGSENADGCDRSSSMSSHSDGDDNIVLGSIHDNSSPFTPTRGRAAQALLVDEDADSSPGDAEEQPLSRIKPSFSTAIRLDDVVLSAADEAETDSRLESVESANNSKSGLDLDEPIA